jgi:hypothetical protein
MIIRWAERRSMILTIFSKTYSWAGQLKSPGVAQVKRQPRVGLFQEEVGGHTGNLPMYAAY